MNNRAKQDKNDMDNRQSQLRPGISRRAFLKGSVIVALLSTVPIKDAVAAFLHSDTLAVIQGKGVASSVALSAMHPSTFAERQGERFKVQSGVQNVPDMELVAVTSQDFSVAKAGLDKDTSLPTECFAVSFRQTSAVPLQQGTYTFTHQQLGTFPLFIVPGAPGKDTQTYVAIFNRVKTGSM